MRKILLSTFLICMFFTGYSQVVTSGANQSNINDLLNRVQQSDFRSFDEVFTSSEIAQLKAYYQFENSMKVNLGTPIFGSDAIGDVVAYGFEAFLAPGFSSFDIEAATSVTTISAGIGSEFAGAVSLDNPDLAYSLTNTGSLYSVDVPTGAYTLLGSLGISDMSGMAFNPVNGQLYAISPTALYSINTSVPSATLIGNLGTSQSLAIALAIDGSGTAYTYDIGDDLLYSINLTTGAATSIGSIGFDGNYAQGMDYDPFTDTVYMAAFNVTTFMAELRSVNTTTGMTTLVSNIAGSTAEFTWVSFVSEEEAEYCIPEATNSSRYINNFTATGNDNSISNLASGFSTGGYGDFTATHTVSQAPEGSVDFTADIVGGTAGFRIWVDWNQDGSFDTTEEVAWFSSGYLSTQTGSFDVPADASVGETRMRIVSHWLSTTGNVDPCATGFTYGEFEDYKFIVEEDEAPTSGCEWTVTVSDDENCGDEVSWTLTDGGGNVVLSGGPYSCVAYNDVQTVTAEGPMTFYIESMGSWGDNTPSYEISNGTEVVASGQLAGGTEVTLTDLNCDGGGDPGGDPVQGCNDTDVAIATNGVAYTSVVSIAEAGTIGTDANLDSVVADIQHTWANDLEIILISPAGTEVALTTNNGSLSGLDTQSLLTFTDTSANAVTGWDGGAPLADYRAEGGATTHPVPFGDGPGVNMNDEFAGESITGDWTLRIYDDASGDVGTLFNFCLNFTVEGGGGGECEWTVTVSDTGFGDEVSWELRDADSNVLLSGGPYGSGYTDTQTVMSEGPVEFYIETMGTFNDNSPVFTIENENGVILSGGAAGGTEATYSDLNCSDLPPPAPENDNCGDITPTELTNGVPVTFNGTTEGGTGSPEELSVLGSAAVWEAVTLTGDCNDLTIDYCGTPAGNMDGNFFIVYTLDCPATAFTIGSYDFTTCGDGNGTLRFTGLPAGTYYLPVIVDPSSNNLGDYVMNVVSEDCFVAEEPNYPCFQGDGLASNGFEDGYNVTAGGTFRNADDFIVDESFTMQYVRLNLFMLPGDTASSVTFNVRADEGGAPSESNIVDTFTAVPTSQVVIGSNFGYNISQVEFILDADRPPLSAGTYWLQPEVTNGGGVAFWEVTTTGSLGGFMHTSEGGGAWVANAGSQGVFFVAGECEEMAEGCFVTGTFEQWPSSTYVPTCSGVVEIITTAGWAGEYSKVQVTAGTEYIFSSSVPTDFITIADEDEEIAFATGTGTVTWTSPIDQVIRFYTHLNEDCEIEEISRTRAVQCGDIPPPPANDDCEDAIALACDESASGTTLGANNSGGNTAGDVFYTFTGNGESQLVTVSLCGSSYDTYLRVFTDCTLSTEIAFNDDSCGLQSELTFTSDGTTTYVIMVEGFSANVGDFVIDITCGTPPPPPAECEDHEVLDNAMENAYFFTNRLAVDIPVGDAGFTIEGTYITIAVPIGTSATSFNFIFYDNNSGLPGTEVDTATGNIIGSEIIGQNFGRDFIQYNVDFDAGVALNANSTYWMEVQSDAEAWDWTSDMTAFIGQTGVINNGGGWADADGGEFVYALYCEEMGVGDMNSFNFAYYPNPVKDYLNIESQKAIESIDAFNLAGQKVISNALLSEGKLNLNNLSPGTYVFRVTLEGGQVETFKIVKK